MKLKKIASLMLAGVMAVSMLAGCSGNGNGGNGGEGEGPVNTDNLSAASVIAELDKDTTDKVSFTADDSVQNALNKSVKDMGAAITGVDAWTIATHTAEVGDIEYVTAAAFDFSQLNKKDADAQTLLWATAIPAYDYSEKVAVDAIAARIDSMIDQMNLPENSAASVANGDTYYKYSYAAKIATVKVESSSGYNGYVAFLTLTATSSEAKVEL